MCQKKFSARPPWAGLAHLQVWAHFYAVKPGQAPASPQGPRGPKLWGTFIYPQTPSGYHPITFGFGPTLGLGSPKTRFYGSFCTPIFTMMAGFNFYYFLHGFKLHPVCKNKKIKKIRICVFGEIWALKVGRFWPKSFISKNFRFVYFLYPISP